MPEIRKHYFLLGVFYQRWGNLPLVTDVPSWLEGGPLKGYMFPQEWELCFRFYVGVGEKHEGRTSNHYATHYYGPHPTTPQSSIEEAVNWMAWQIVEGLMEGLPTQEILKRTIEEAKPTPDFQRVSEKIIGTIDDKYLRFVGFRTKEELLGALTANRW